MKLLTVALTLIFLSSCCIFCENSNRKINFSELDYTVQFEDSSKQSLNRMFLDSSDKNFYYNKGKFDAYIEVSFIHLKNIKQ